MRVFLTRRLPIDAASRAPAGISVETFPHDRVATREEILAGARECEGLVSLLTDRIDDALLAACPKLRVVANYAVGVNNVDLAACARRGIVVCNTPGVLTEATAELALALMLALTRRLREGERLARSGGWAGWGPTQLLGAGLTGRTLGIVGLGRIGAAVARRAIACGMTVLHCSPRDPDPAIRRVGLDELLATADVVSLHAPLTEATRHLLDRAAIERMKPGSILVNTARGPLVDEAALADALARGRIAGAGLDVFEEEPAIHPALAGREDVVLLPHLGSATRSAREAMALLAIDGCFAVLAGRTPANVVRG
jgi:glyoxylate reductase